MNEEHLSPEIFKFNEDQVRKLAEKIPELAQNRDLPLPEKWSRHPEDLPIFDNTLIYDAKFYVYTKGYGFLQIMRLGESKYLDIAPDGTTYADNPTLFSDVINAMKELVQFLTPKE